MTEEQNETTPPKKDINTIKIEKEIEKLQYEIDKLKNESKGLIIKGWWKRPQYIAAFTPVIVGILTLIVAWWSGFLQAQSKLNEAQKLTFEQTKKLNQQYIDTLRARISYDSLKQIRLTKSIDSLKSLESLAKQRLNIFLNDKRNTTEKIASLIKENVVLLNNILALDKSLKENQRIDKNRDIYNDSLNKIEQKGPGSLNSRLKIYPNPVKDIATLNIKTTKFNTIAIVIIRDEQGEIVYTRDVALKKPDFSANIDIPSLIKGTYIITIYFENGDRETMKFINSK